MLRSNAYGPEPGILIYITDINKYIPIFLSREGVILKKKTYLLSRYEVFCSPI